MVVEPVLTQPTTHTAERLPASVGWLYSVGEIASATKTVIFGIFTLFFYTSVMGLPGTAVGIASALGVLWDAVVDPLIGQRSDTTTSRWGRRHGFMLLGALTMAPTFWAFWSPPPRFSGFLLFGWLLVTTLLARTSTSLFSVPYYALGAELAQDYGERTRLTAVRGIVALLGTLLTTVMAFSIFFPDTGSGDPKLVYAGYPAMGLWLGIAMSVAALVATLATLRHRSVVVAPVPRHRPAPPAGFLTTLHNPAFRVLWGSFGLYYVALVVNGTLAIHYLSSYARITASDDLAVFQIAFYGAAVVGVVAWLAVSRFVDKHRLYVVSALALAALMLGAVLLLGEGRVFGTGNVVAYGVARGVAGFFGCIIWFVPASMVADVVDDDEMRTGRRREGAYFGMLSFGQQFATGLALVCTGIGLDVYVGLQAGAATQSPDAVQRIGVLFGLVPAMLLIAAAMLGTRYTLTRSRIAAIQQALHSRR